MFLPITVPRGVSLTDIKRLQSHSTWYLRKADRHGPALSSKRFARAKQLSPDSRLRRIGPVAHATVRTGPVL